MNRHHGVVAVALVAFFLGIAVAPTRIRAQDDDDSKETAAREAKEKKVRKLLKVSGQHKLGKQVLDEMMDSFAKNPNLPPGFAAKFKELAKPGDLVDIVVPIYADSLEDDALDAAIAFFESEGGKSFAKAQPAIARASMLAGQKWGTELAHKALKALEEDRKKGIKPQADEDDE